MMSAANATLLARTLRHALVVFCALAMPLLAAGAARAQTPPIIDINRPNSKPAPIAITDFVGEQAEASRVGVDIAGVISNDLERSGLFQPIDKSAFVERITNPNAPPRFGDWRAIGAQFLVSGAAQLQPDGRLRVEFRLWDPTVGQQLTGLAYFTQPQNWRRIAHIVADAIYKRVTGEDGYFDTRIVYVAETGPLNRRVKRLAIMDQDGYNHRYLTDGRYLVLTPRFSPTLQEITYMAFERDQPRVYVYNVDTGRQEVLGDFPGMTFAPRFSPDGNKVVMSLATDGNSEIYTMDIRTRAVQRLTNHPAIDTSPCFSPDGQRIVFNSDRGGSQQLYVMGADGSDPRRISFGQGTYATPVWSPRGDLIAFTKIFQNKFYIGVMRPDGSGERLLTESFLDEGPTWSPNGRVLMFFRQQPQLPGGRGGSVRLYSIDLTGSNERQIVTPTDASDPAWSPLIPQ